MTHVVEKAISIAVNAHAGTLDKSGQPYILHPLRVMLAQQNNLTRIAAVLHDAVEDTMFLWMTCTRQAFRGKQSTP